MLDELPFIVGYQVTNKKKTVSVLTLKKERYVLIAKSMLTWSQAKNSRTKKITPPRTLTCADQKLNLYTIIARKTRAL